MDGNTPGITGLSDLIGRASSEKAFAAVLWHIIL